MKIDIFNTEKQYDIIYADPPWSYNDKGCHGAAESHYKTMSIEQIKALPVKKIAKSNSVLFLWATYPKLQEALELIESWGFKYKSIAFQWVKLNRNTDINTFTKEAFISNSIDEAMKKNCFFGLGRWTRGNTEPCLIATKGKVSRKDASVGQLVFAPLTKHSAKPYEVRDKIVSLIGGGREDRTICSHQC